MIAVIPKEIVAQHIIGEYIAQAIVRGGMAQHGSEMEQLILAEAKRLVAKMPRLRRILTMKGHCSVEGISALARGIMKDKVGEDHTLSLGDVEMLRPKGAPTPFSMVFKRNNDRDDKLDVLIYMDEPQLEENE